jgi:lipid II:glycine glycyltransferase (peptidoglycan interpeptide bridge formation enzyme)
MSSEQATWNKKASHPLQAWEWGEFRRQTGVTVVRENGLQVTIHPIPYTPWTIGYYPKGGEITDTVCASLSRIAQKNNCLFIKCEPKVEIGKERIERLTSWGFVAGRSLFTKYNFVLDVTLTETELLAAMKQKTRYNIRVAEKKGVVVTLSHTPVDFERYLKLTQETTRRQGFYAHSESYHRLMWSVLGTLATDPNSLTAHLLTATYQNQVITTWVLFRFKDTLYYPYGASTREHREVMANNLVMWEAIKLAKRWGLTYLDMWGALGAEPDAHDPWYGFHTFKAGYGARHVEYIGTWDYVARPVLYRVYRIIESIRWTVLRFLR